MSCHWLLVVATIHNNNNEPQQQQQRAVVLILSSTTGLRVDLSKSHGVHTVASILKLFLAELVDPLLTYELMDCFMLSVDVIGAATDEGTFEPNLSAICSCVRLLPPGNRVILKRLGYRDTPPHTTCVHIVYG
jgi:hypothetical protein